MNAASAGKSPGFAEHPDYRITFEPSPKRVRLVAGGETVADTLRARLLRETGHMPVYYFPREDVRMDLLESTDQATHCPFKGEASYWSLRTTESMRENAVWSYETPYEEMAAMRDYLAFYRNDADHWYEEDEEIFGHPRDPYHRIDVRPSSRHVQVVLAGETVADSRRGLFLFETGLRTRYYLLPEDVRTQILEPSGTTSICPYKGAARYWSAKFGDQRFEDVVWSYPEPLPENPRIKGRLCFFDEGADAVLIDGAAVPKAETL